MRFHPAAPRDVLGWGVRFEPTTLLLVATAGSALVGAAGAISSGMAQSRAAKYNAQVAENNAIEARQAAAFEEQRTRDRAQRLASAQRAAFGASGVSLEGSPLEVLAQSAQDSELDALAVRYSGSVQEARFRSQAALDRMQGEAAQTSSYFSAGASLLGGASNFAKVYGGKPVD